MGRSRSQQKDKQPRKVISVSIQQDVKLHTVENAWKPGNKAADKDKEDPEALMTQASDSCVFTKHDVSLQFNLELNMSLFVKILRRIANLAVFVGLLLSNRTENLIACKFFKGHMLLIL